MRFTALLLAGFAAVASCIPAQQVANNINQITTLSRNLQTPARSLTVLDGPLLAIGQGNFPPIIQGFTEIVNVGTAFLNGMNPEQYNEADSTLIFDAFRTFVRVHQELLNILIGRAGLFSTVPFVGQPVSAVLRAVEGVVDALAFSLIDMAESAAQGLQQEADALGSTLDAAINAYSGLVN
ncbi:UVI-1 [Stachybotrys elegans]|uniref:UVI-1 n=1 Tax=Stachybotrys elegans TaxID=80388 RepID=A0A8K0SIT7_9HYPO|nr:UVI-1 [Stachybotrys elegans]